MGMIPLMSPLMSHQSPAHQEQPIMGRLRQGGGPVAVAPRAVLVVDLGGSAAAASEEVVVVPEVVAPQAAGSTLPALKDLGRPSGRPILVLDLPLLILLGLKVKFDLLKSIFRC